MGRTADDLLAAKAAVLAAEGRTPEESAIELVIGVSAVYKRLRRARDLGYLEPAPPPVLNVARVPAKLLQQAQDEVRWAEMRRNLFARLARLQRDVDYLPREISIGRSPNRRSDGPSWLERLEAVAALAARRLRPLLHTEMVVGVAWGVGLHYLVEELAALGAPAGCRPIFFPTVGSFPFLKKYEAKLTSTTVAWELSALFHGGQAPATQINLDVVPAYLSAEFGEHRELLLRFFSTFPAFREVFGFDGRSGLLDRADCIVTGMGDMPSHSDSGSPSLRARLALEGLDAEHLSQIAVGDIAGNLLPKDGLSPEAQLRLQEINDRFVGPSLAHLRGCAQRASAQHTPGVVALAHGKEKALAVLKAIRLGLVTELAIDDELGDALLELLPAERRKSPVWGQRLPVRSN